MYEPGKRNHPSTKSVDSKSWSPLPNHHDSIFQLPIKNLLEYAESLPKVQRSEVELLLGRTRGSLLTECMTSYFAMGLAR
jgi:hypothetical protein